ncbi:MAG: 16S rRNA (adenine(1518)-N(6)/adenine(1519)-N(6))-dimethyltransferase RsmA [Clostridia bacterium]|nr:16S rRNA (adenine(1518)-N(6)/adenine(1519)-N(6))-dimethyltransferase RsmA [Clostridia bacterium]
MINLYNPKQVRDLMSAYGVTFRKEFGQNFLMDSTVVEDIADAAGETHERTILEIGPGVGTLTRELAYRYEKVVALEIDRGLIPILSETLADCSNVQVINEDVMKADLPTLLKADFERGPVSVCANLPYYITTPILMKLLESGLPFDSITVMVQKEVADRLSAKAKSKDYGAITVALAYYGVAERLFLVPAGKFLPPPKVDSAVVRIKLFRESPYRDTNADLLFRTIKAAFGERRKILANALSAGFPELDKAEITACLSSMGLSPTVRGEELDISLFVSLTSELEKILAKTTK